MAIENDSSSPTAVSTASLNSNCPAAIASITPSTSNKTCSSFLSMDGKFVISPSLPNPCNEFPESMTGWLWVVMRE